MSSDELASSGELSHYDLVAFPDYKDADGRIFVDIVLNNWTSFNRKTNRHEAKFPPPPYNKKTNSELNNLLKNFEPAPAFWSKYNIEFRGRASTFQDAKARLKKLEYKENVFTTDSERKEKKKPESKKKTGTKKLKTDTKEEEKIFNVSKPHFSGDKNVHTNHSEVSSASSEDLSTSCQSDVFDTPKIIDKGSKRKRKGTSKIQPKKAVSQEKFSSKIQSVDPKRATTKKPKPQGLTKSTLASNFQNVVQTIPKHGKFVKNVGPQGSSASNCSTPIHDIPKNREHQETTKSSSNEGERSLEFEGIFDRNVPSEEFGNTKLLFDRIMNALHIIHLDLKELQREQREIKALIPLNAGVPELPQSFGEKYEIILPLSKMEDFDAFELQLKNTLTFRNEFKVTFKTLVDRNDILPRTIANIIKAYLSRDIVLQFNAVRKNEQKTLVFKETEFYKCLIDVITKLYKTNDKVLIEKDFLKALGPVLTNAVDWDGYRSLRTKKVNTDDKPKSRDLLDDEEILDSEE